MISRSWRYLRRLSAAWSVHGNSASAAAIAYYALFALAPILVFATAAAGWFIGADDARLIAEERLSRAIGHAGAQVARTILQDARLSPHGLLATFVSGGLMLLGASAMFVQLRSALDAIFGPPLRRSTGAFLAALLGRFLAVVVVIAVGGLLVVVLLGNVLLHAIGGHLSTWIGLPPLLWEIVRTVLSIVLVSMVLAATYRWLPSSRPRLPHLWRGVLTATLLLEGIRFAFEFYIARNLIASAYGPSTALVAFVVWTYFAARIVLLGAEIAANSPLHAAVEFQTAPVSA